MPKLTDVLIPLVLLTPMLAEARPTVSLDDGTVASDCATFEAGRASHVIGESAADALAAAEYLDCSLTWGGTAVPAGEDWSALMKTLQVLDIPSSLGPRATPGLTLVGLGATYDAREQALHFTEDAQHVSIRLVRHKGDDFLAWVSDEILDAEYRAYFPVLLHWSKGRLTVSPYYSGGF